MDEKTELELFGVFERLKGIYGPAHALMEKWDDFYRGKVDCGVSENAFEHVVPIGFGEVENAVAQTTEGKWTFEVDPFDKIKEQKVGEKLKKACGLSLALSNTINQGDIGREGGRFIGLRGEGVFKGPFIDAERASEGEFCLYYTPLDPLFFFPDPAGRFQFEAYERYVGEVKEDVAHWNEATKKKYNTEPYYEDWKKIDGFEDDYNKTLWIEYWSPKKRCYIVSDKSQKLGYPLSAMQDNAWGFSIYNWRYSGKGKGVRGKPEERCIGALAAMESTIEAICRSYSAIDAYLSYYAFPDRFVKAEYMSDYQMLKGGGAGKIIPITDGGMPSQGGLEDHIPQQLNPAMYQYIASLGGHIQDLGGSRSLMGTGQEESGVQAMTRIRQATLHHLAFREAYQQLMSDALSKIPLLVGNDVLLKDGLCLTGSEKLSSSELPKNVRITASLEPTDPLENQTKLELLMRLLERGVVDEDEVADLGKIPVKGSRLVKQALKAMILTNPQVQQAYAMELLQQDGMEQAAQMLGSTGAGNNDRNKQTIPTGNQRQPVMGPAGNAPVQNQLQMGGTPGGL